MKRFFVVSLLAIVSLLTSTTSLYAHTENREANHSLQLCFNGASNAIYEFDSPANFSVSLLSGIQAVTLEDYVYMGGALLRFSVTSSNNVPITKVIVVYGGFREEIDIIETFSGKYQVLVPVLNTSGTQMVYITAYAD